MIDQERLEKLALDFKDESAKKALEKAKDRRDEGWEATVRQINQFLHDLIREMQPHYSRTCLCPVCQRDTQRIREVLESNGFDTTVSTIEGVGDTITVTENPSQPGSSWRVAQVYEPEQMTPKTPWIGSTVGMTDEPKKGGARGSTDVR